MSIYNNVRVYLSNIHQMTISLLKNKKNYLDFNINILEK